MPTVVSVFGVEPSRIGGTETYARELSVQLGERGWDSVLCFETYPPSDVAKFLELPNVTLEILNNPTNFNWVAAKRFAEILRRYKPDILHLHFVGFVGVYPWLARLLSVKKIFFTDHSSRPAGYKGSRAPFWKRRVVRFINYPITKVICVSKYGCRCMKALDLLPEERYELVYNAVDLSRVSNEPVRAAQFRSRFAIPKHKKIVVQLSWIIPEKGIPDLLEVARLVQLRNKDIQFVIAGEGPYREQYMKQAQALGLSKNVTWTGLIKDPFSEGVFDAADVVCQLSRWEELFGWMIAEAMAFGKPVIATRVGGIPELITDAKSGYLVEPGDVAETAAKLIYLMSDPVARQSMGEEGKRTAQADFSLRKNIRQLLGTYGL